MAERQLVIAHVLNGLMFGGVESLCLQLIEKAPPGTRHVLFNLDPSKIDMRDAFVSRRDVTLVDRPYAADARARFVVAMARDLRRIHADGVIAYAFGLHVLVALAARAARVGRMVVHAGNPPPGDGRRRGLWRAIVVASRLLDVPIKACSALVDRELRALAGTLPRGSEPVHNGVDVGVIERVAGSARAQRLAGEPRIVGMVARLNSIKDHDTLLRAFAAVQRRIASSRLWLIGDGERGPGMEALARELGIADSVRFWGNRADVHALLGGMDVFAFATTRDEGFGIALAEAMAARTPIVASDVEACREVLGDGEAGKLVPPGNAEELADAIVELLADPQMARAMTDRAHARALRCFDAAACAQRYYASLTPERRGDHGG